MDVSFQGPRVSSGKPSPPIISSPTDSACGAFIPMKSFNAVVDVVESWYLGMIFFPGNSHLFPPGEVRKIILKQAWKRGYLSFQEGMFHGFLRQMTLICLYSWWFFTGKLPFCTTIWENHLKQIPRAKICCFILREGGGRWKSTKIIWGKMVNINKEWFAHLSSWIIRKISAKNGQSFIHFWALRADLVGTVESCGLYT